MVVAVEGVAVGAEAGGAGTAVVEGLSGGGTAYTATEERGAAKPGWFI